jgi:hypothetical protein
VRGDADAPAVLLVGSSMLSWPGELCERLAAGGRRVIGSAGHRLPAHAIADELLAHTAH